MIKIGEKYQVPTFTEDEFKRRWKAIQKLMESRNVDCLLIIDSMDIRYVSNLSGGRSELENYCVLPRQGEPSLFISWGELYCYAKDIVPMSEIINLAGLQPVVKKIKALGLEKGTIGIDSIFTNQSHWSIQYTTYDYLQKELPEAKFIEAKDILIACRQIKSEAEIEFLRKTQELGEKAFMAMVNIAKPGVTDREVIGAAIGTLVSGGADPDTRILYNSTKWPNPRPESDPNAYPYHMGGTERKLQKGDVMFWELYSSYGGYFSDICLPISLGKPDVDLIERAEICKEMIRLARDLLRPGNTAKEIDEKLSEYLSSKLKKPSVAIAGLKDMVPVQANPRAEIGKFQPGMVIVIPPMTVWDRGPQHIFGETYIVTEGEPKRIGNLPTEIVVV